MDLLVYIGKPRGHGQRSRIKDLTREQGTPTEKQIRLIKRRGSSLAASRGPGRRDTALAGRYSRPVKSSAPTFTSPDVATILIGGQRSRTNRASLRPSIVPGIWISVKTTWIAGRT